jgi:putative DNA primase/helicase
MKLNPTGDFPCKLARSGFPHQPAGDRGKLPVTLQNVAYLLSQCGIEARYDVIKKRGHFCRGEEALEFCDLQSLANQNGLGGMHFPEFVTTLARRNPINPVADWIASKPWDGKDRLAALYATVHVQEAFPAYARDFLLKRWLVSCVAAVLEPTGFKARGVLVLQGEQGVGKTSWIARLVPAPMSAEWVKLDHHLDAHDKDSILGAVAHWIVEVGELDSSFRKDVARIKGFLTNSIDKVRRPYGRSDMEMDRRTVSAGTVNEWNFLVDQTGNSRWWTIPVTKLDFTHDIDMQQVFAQLAVLHGEGEQWWLTGPEEDWLANHNRQHQAVSVIEERLRERIDPDGKKPRSMTASKVLEEIGYRNPTNAQAKEAGAVLRSLYGPPKKIQGIMKWKVALLDGDMAMWQAKDEDEEY